MKINGMLLCVLLSCFTPISVLAAEIDVIHCGGCNSVGMRNLATSMGAGTHYVWNDQGGIFAAYDVAYEDTRPPTLRARLVTPNPAAQEMFNNLMKVYRLGGNSFDRVVTLQLPLIPGSTKSPDSTYYAAGGVYTPESEIVVQSASGRSYYNAYDVVSSSHARNVVHNALVDDWARQFIVVRAMVSNEIVFWRQGNDAPVRATTVVQFSDGSRAVFKFDFTQGVWDYVNGTAIDSSGNRLPESREAVSGNGGKYFIGNEVNYGDWLQLMSSYGIPVTGAGAGGYACTSVEGYISCVPF